MTSANPVWPVPLWLRDLQPPIRFVLGNVQKTCCCKDTRWTITGGENSSALARAHDCTVVGVVPLGWQCCKPLEEHGCTWACFSCTCMTLPVGQRKHVQLHGLADHTFVSSYAHGVGSKWSSVVSSLREQMGWTLTSNNALSNLPPQKPLATMSSLESSSVAVLRVVNAWPERGVAGGALHWRHGKHLSGDQPWGHEPHCVDSWYLRQWGTKGHVPCHIHTLWGGWVESSCT